MAVPVSDYILKWVNAITDDDGGMARQLLSNKDNLKLALTLPHVHNKEINIPADVKSVCPIITSAYRPDDAWCVATVYNARHVMRAMKEFGFPVSQVNHRGNTFLHCIIAQASIGNEEDEERAVSTVKFIKSLISNDEYKNSLLMENDDGLRPLELASHLGTFALFQFLFETKGLYISKIHNLGFSTIEYFDITEYIVGERYLRSPPHTMMLLDRGKMNHKAVQTAFLCDPMKTWFAAISYSNMPFIFIVAMFKMIHIAGFFASLVLTKAQVIRFKSLHAHNVSSDDGDDEEDKVLDIKNIPLILVLLYNAMYPIAAILFGAMYAVLRLNMYRTMAWRTKIVSGQKDIIVFRWVYWIAEIFTLVGILVISLDFFILQISKQHDKIFSSDCMNMMTLVAVFACVWNMLYYVQLISGLGLYVIAVLRMLCDFMAFGIIFLLFFFCYVFGFYVLDDNADSFLHSAYNTFQLMLNIVNYSDGTPTLKVMHVTFIFMIVYLLLNILIAIFASSFESVHNNKEILFTIQRLSVFLRVEPVVAILAGKLQNYFRKKYLIFEDDKVYITRAVIKPVRK